MSKISLRSVLATLCGLILSGFLAACGGGGDIETALATPVPAGIKTCELREVAPGVSIRQRDYVIRPELRMDRVNNADGSYTIRAVDGNVGDVYADITSSAIPYYSEILRAGIVSSELHLAGNARYSVYMYARYGLSQGVSVIGAPTDHMSFGTETGQPFREGDIQGLTAVPGITYLLAPYMSIGDDYVFTVGLPIQYAPPSHAAQRFMLYVQEVIHPRAAGHVPYWTCEVVDLQPMEQVKLVGGKQDQSEYFVELRATVPLDDGTYAASERFYFYVTY